MIVVRSSCKTYDLVWFTIPSWVGRSAIDILNGAVTLRVRGSTMEKEKGYTYTEKTEARGPTDLGCTVEFGSAGMKRIHKVVI